MILLFLCALWVSPLHARELGAPSSPDEDPQRSAREKCVNEVKILGNPNLSLGRWNELLQKTHRLDQVRSILENSKLSPKGKFERILDLFLETKPKPNSLTKDEAAIFQSLHEILAERPLTESEELALILHLVTEDRIHMEHLYELLDQIIGLRLEREPESMASDVEHLIESLEDRKDDYRPRVILNAYLRSLSGILQNRYLTEEPLDADIWRWNVQNLFTQSLYRISENYWKQRERIISEISSIPIIQDVKDDVYKDESVDEALYWLQAFDHLLDEEWLHPQDPAELQQLGDLSDEVTHLRAEAKKIGVLQQEVLELHQFLAPKEEAQFIQTGIYFLNQAQNAMGALAISVDRASKESSNKLESLSGALAQIWNLSQHLEVFHKKDKSGYFDTLYWNLMGQLAQLSEKLNESIQSSSEIPENSELRKRSLLLVQIDAFQWARMMPAIESPRMMEASRIQRQIADMGYVANEIPKEWIPDSNYETRSWINLLEKTYQHSRHFAPLTEDSFDLSRVKSYIHTVSHSNEPAEILLAIGFLEQVFDSLQAEESKLINSGSSFIPTPAAQFILYKHQESIRQKRRRLREELESIPVNRRDSNINKLIEEIRDYRSDSQAYLLYLGVQSIEEMKERQNFLKSVRFKDDHHSFEVLEHLGLIRDPETFKQKIRQLMSPPAP